MNNKIFTEVKKFTVEKAAVEDGDVKESTLLESDLGIYGEDAVEYIITFGNQFNVDVSGFMAARYFSSEGGFKLPPLINRFLGIKKHHESMNYQLHI